MTHEMPNNYFLLEDIIQPILVKEQLNYSTGNAQAWKKQKDSLKRS